MPCRAPAFKMGDTDRLPYYYVHTSPDFMEEYAAVVADSDGSVLPEVGFDV